jgi:PncC family amidohydrolase
MREGFSPSGGRMNSLDINAQAEKNAAKLIEKLKAGKYILSLAESCTAGLVSDLLARVSGASAVLWGSFVCYTLEAKKRMLGIDGAFLEKYGLVSAETACEMASRALDISGSAISAAVTGLAGPLGDGSDKPVGTVFISIARRLNGNSTVNVKPFFFSGSRAEIRTQAANAVLEELLEVIG